MNPNQPAANLRAQENTQMKAIQMKAIQMKAIVLTKYGSADALELQQVTKSAPKDHHVLINVQAVSLNAADHHLMKGALLVRLTNGLLRPKHPILGADVAGRVEAVGQRVKRFKVGDEVFGDFSSCGFGGFAEYVCVPEEALISKPRNLNFEQAAAVPLAAVTALQGLRDQGQLQAGQKVLINGASGGVGTFALQIAKTLGATVTAVCSSSKLAQARELGADEVVDYTQQDIIQSGQKYDLILDVAAYRSPREYKAILGPKGRYVLVGGSFGKIVQMLMQAALLSKAGGQQFSVLMAKANAQDLSFLKDLIEAGKVKPVVEKVYAFDQIPEAMRYLGEGHAKGKLVVRVARD
jgi:NADPH:quinone reductase-like Zn-dependent oxidoreductase